MVTARLHWLTVALVVALSFVRLARSGGVNNEDRMYSRHERLLSSCHHCCLFQPLLSSSTGKYRRTRTGRRYQDDDDDDDEHIINTLSPSDKKGSQTTATATSSSYDPITDWSPPPPDVVAQTIHERIQPLRRLTSPVFFSTNNKSGRRHRGLGHLPSAASERPLLFVGNHQLGGLDIWLVVPQLIEERGVFVRGLGHPVIFQDAESHLRDGGPTFLPDSTTAGKQGTFDLYQKFGAVMTSPKNLYRLLQTQQAVMHFPGGAREAYHGQGEAHQLFWPQVDFVRMAARFNATIVPMTAIGAADSVYILANPERVLELPFGLGDNQLVANSFLTVRQAARYDEQRREGQFIRPPPLVWPKQLLPARHYFLFGKAFRTNALDPHDRVACQQLYQDIQTEIQKGFADLLRAREKDPFQKNSALRFLYEQVTGKQAPTFSVKELD